MKRRDFLKLSIAGVATVLMPQYTYATKLDLSKISFSSGVYSSNKAQTIIIFLAGGASQLAGNITNLDEIEKNSNSSYKSHFGDITATTNGCWSEAGGDDIEKMISDGDLTLYRTCYSAVREANGNKAHGVCSEQNQKGNFDVRGAGIITNIAKVLEANGVVNENTIMPFVTMNGESFFYAPDDSAISSYLKPIGIDSNFSNPYERAIWTTRNWIYYTDEERKNNSNYNKSDEEGGFDPQLSKDMDSLAQKHNRDGKIKDAFAKRGGLSNFIEEIKKAEVPDLGEDSYIEDNKFSDNLKAAITILDKNPDTKIITIGNAGLGGWDDHSYGKDYVVRARGLFRSLRAAMAHLKALGKDGNINIMVFAEFGRNVNLNATYGWDHGNLQNLYILGGKDYFNHKGVVGETTLDVASKGSRLWLKPKKDSYWFEPMSIASTIYKIYGIQNPEELTGGYGALNLV